MVFSVTSHGKSPCAAVKHYTGKGVCKTPQWSNTWLSANAYSLPGGNAISEIFFGISKETMTDTRWNLQKRFTDGKTIPDTRSNHGHGPTMQNV